MTRNKGGDETGYSCAKENDSEYDIRPLNSFILIKYYIDPFKYLISSCQIHAP